MTSVKQFEQSLPHCKCFIRVRDEEDDDGGDDGGGGDSGIQPPLPGQPATLLFRMRTLSLSPSSYLRPSLHLAGSLCTYEALLAREKLALICYLFLVPLWIVP